MPKPKTISPPPPPGTPDGDAPLSEPWAFQSLNMLAGGVAHDLSNVIGGILGSAELLKLDYDPAHPDIALFQQIFKSGERLMNMIHQLKTFSQRPASQRTLIRLTPAVTGALAQFQALLPASVRLTAQLDPESPLVLADASQIEQVVLSLCTNAWRSLPDQQGQILVRLDSCVADPALAAAHPGLRAGAHVRLSVCDQGLPIGKGVMERLFEPFARKLPGGQNSGLELFMVREIAHAHGGIVAVSSAPGEGTTFRLYFPVLKI